MASTRLLPMLLAGGVGVVGGIYIWNQPLQELSGKGPAAKPVTEGRSQNVKDGTHESGSSAQPHSPLKYGGASPNKHDTQTIAGTTAEARRGNSTDHSVKTRSNASEQDGTSGGGVGVAEMRERKMAGMGLPSPQGGDTKAQPVEARAADGEMGGVKKQKKWWLGGW